MANSTTNGQILSQGFGEIVKRLDKAISHSESFPAFREFFLDELDLALQAIGLSSRSEWLSLHPEDFEVPDKRPSIETLTAQDMHINNDDLWYPVLDHLGFIGVFVFDESTLSDHEKSFLNTAGPFLLSYFRRLEHYESASVREELNIPDREFLTDKSETGPRGLQEIFNSSVESISRIFECDNCRLFWLESPDILRLRAEYPSSDNLHSELLVSDDPVIGQVIEEGKSIIINDMPESDSTVRRSSNIKSFLSVPIQVDGKVKGAINLSSQAPDVYTKKDLQRFSDFCDHLSTVFASTQELVDLTRYVDKIMKNLPVGVLTYRIRQDDVYFNNEAREILGIDEESMDREKFEKVMKDRLLDEEFLDLLNIDAGLENVSTKKYKIKDNHSDSPRVIKSFRNSIRDSENLLSGILIVISEVTEQVRLNEQVSRTERLAALGELASSLAHEIKNPLTSIQGFIQMLPDRKNEEDFVLKTAEILKKETNRLDELIENLQSYAKPQTGQRQNFQLSELVEETMTLLRKQAEKNDIEVSISILDELRVFGDPSKIKQVIMNLSLNAIEEMQDGGKLTIEAEEVRNEHVLLTVEDTGSGMEDEQIEKIFNPFYTTKEEGTGLGMAITYRIVEDHDGILSINSSPGEGTIVEVMLPQKKSAPPIEGGSMVG